MQVDLTNVSDTVPRLETGSGKSNRVRIWHHIASLVRICIQSSLVRRGGWRYWSTYWVDVSWVLHIAQMSRAACLAWCGALVAGQQASFHVLEDFPALRM